MKWQFSVLFTLIFCSLLGCGIRGEIVPIQTKHSYEGEFKFTEHSHVIIKLYAEESSENNPTVATHRIDSVAEFPIYFSIPFPSDVDIDKLRISAKVISGKGDNTREGDFVTETVTPVSRWTSNRIEVVGLESCSASNKGGFCSGNEPN